MRLFFPLLSSIIWLPLCVVLLLLVVNSKHKKIFRSIALATTLLQGILVAVVLSNFKNVSAIDGMAFVEKLPWLRLSLGNLGIFSVDYCVGVDGLNVGLILLSAFILPIGVLASWKVERYAKAYFILYLIMDTLIMGSFMAQDFLLFYIFFEMALLPIFFFIGIWGGNKQAAIKFFLFTLFGALLILVVLIGLALSVYDPIATGINVGLLSSDAAAPILSNTSVVQNAVCTCAIKPYDIVHSVNFKWMQSTNNFVPGATLGLFSNLIFGIPARFLAFIALVIGFCVKIAAVPLHSWLPDAHVEAPTPISIILAALLLKIGGYGLIRIAYNIFPEGAIHYSFAIGVVGVTSIIYAAFNALAAKDLKIMVAYSSIAHMGFVLLGVASLTYEGINGAVYQMISHGFISTLLFLVAGVIDSRAQSRIIGDYGGLATIMPRFTCVAVIVFFAAMGLPGFSGFIAEFLILLGAFQPSLALLPKILGILGAFGVLLNASYWIWTIQRVFFGPLYLKNLELKSKLSDLSFREYVMFVPLIGMILMMGIFPHLVIDLITSHLGKMITRICEVGGTNLDLLGVR